jgi:uncharacterized protein (TIGR00251 family)
MYIKVIVFPDSKREFVEERAQDTLAIWIRQSAQRGEANKRVLAILSERFPGRQIKIVNGHLGPRKLIQIV